jgi:hypothetical protein
LNFSKKSTSCTNCSLYGLTAKLWTTLKQREVLRGVFFGKGFVSCASLEVEWPHRGSSIELVAIVSQLVLRKSFEIGAVLS